MALIKCPSCGEEISDKSGKCVKCGFDVQEYRRRLKLQELAQQKIECPECGAVVSGDTKLCPKCGYPIGKESNLREKNVPKFIKRLMADRKKVLLAAALLVIALVVLGVCITRLGHNELSQYSDLIGKTAKELPPGVETQEIGEGLMLAKEKKQILGYEGTVNYYYQEKAVGDSEPEEIGIVVWQGMDSKYTEEEVSKFLDYLIGIYGKYDDSYETESEFSDIDNKGYVWKNEKGVRAELRTDVKYTQLSINWYPKEAFSK